VKLTLDLEIHVFLQGIEAGSYFGVGLAPHAAGEIVEIGARVGGVVEQCPNATRGHHALLPLTG
jgi:hypothetical protein